MAKSQLKDYAGAIKDFDELPTDEYARISKAFILSIAEDASLRNPTQALKLAEEELRKKPKDAYAMNAKSCALAAKGDYQAAIASQESTTSELPIQLRNWYVGPNNPSSSGTTLF
jgi:tetratricopeptide (TPR) repeat protein